jgi:hypothetical protein
VTGVGKDKADHAVEVRFRFHPGERILYTLLFVRLCQILTAVGAIVVAISFVPAAATFQPALLALGVPLLLGCIWQPYATKLKSLERSYKATSDGLAWHLEDYGGAVTPWPGFRGYRHFAGALLLEQRACPALPIPLRAFGPGQLAEFEQLVDAGLSSDAPAQVVPSDAGAPLFSFQTQPPRFWQLVRIRAAEMDIRVLILLVWACVLMAAAMVSGGEVAPAIAVLVMALVVASAPWTVALIATAAGRRALQACEVVVYRAGYRAVGEFEGWVSWASFGKAHETPDGLVLYMGRSRNHVHLWTTSLTDSQREVLRSVLREADLLPVQTNKR